MASRVSEDPIYDQEKTLDRTDSEIIKFKSDKKK